MQRGQNASGSERESRLVMRPASRVAGGLLLTLVTLAGGCWTPDPDRPELQAWVASDMIQLTDASPRPADPLILDVKNRLSLVSGANETVSFQLVVDATGQLVSGLHATLSPLKSPEGRTLDPAQVRLYRMFPVKVSEFPAWYLRLVEEEVQPASYYDALVRADAGKYGQPFELAAGERLALWIDVSVAKQTPPGQYTGSITMESATHKTWSIPLVLDVYDYVLPDERPLRVVGGFDHRAIYRAFVEQDGRPYEPVRMDRTNPLVRQGLSVMRQMMLLAHDHRVDLFETTMRPTLRRELSGRMNILWDDYDNVVGPYLSGSAFEDRIGVGAWPTPFTRDWPPPDTYGGGASEEYAGVAAEVVAECRRHFAALGASDRAFHWPCREEVTPKSLAQTGALAKLIRSADGDANILSQVPPALPPETTWKAPPELGVCADVFAPRGEWFDPSLPALADRPGPLKGAWLAPGLPPYVPSLSVTARPADARALPLVAWRYGCKGVFLGETLNWPAVSAGDVFASPAGAETRLFYPGKPLGLDEVLPSVRLQRLRRGLQDAARLGMLRQLNRAAVADAIATAMIRYAGLAAVGDHYQDVRLDGWVKDAPTWEIMHRLLAEEVRSADGVRVACHLYPEKA